MCTCVLLDCCLGSQHSKSSLVCAHVCSWIVVWVVSTSKSSLVRVDGRSWIVVLAVSTLYINIHSILSVKSVYAQEFSWYSALDMS